MNEKRVTAMELPTTVLSKNKNKGMDEIEEVCKEVLFIRKKRQRERTDVRSSEG